MKQLFDKKQMFSWKQKNRETKRQTVRQINKTILDNRFKKEHILAKKLR